MIYLFNSAYRPLYAVDVLNVLALPEGATVVHRYRVRGNYQHVHDDLIQGLTGKRGVERVWQGRDRLVRTLGVFRHLNVPVPRAAEVLLLFVDRDKNYTYHPLRRGTLLETWERDNYLYFRVKLGEFIASHTQRVAEVSESIKFALKNEGPHSPANPLHPTQDGYYAIQGPDAVGGKPDVLTGEDAWNAAVENLGKTPRFASTEARSVVFVRTALQRQGGRGNERPMLSGVLERLPIRKDTVYELRLSYRTTVDKPESSAAEVAVEHGDGLQLLDAAPLPVDSLSNDTVKPFVTKRYAEDRYSFIRIATRTGGSAVNPQVLGPSFNVLIALRETRGFWMLVTLFLLLFVLTSLVMSVEPAGLGAAATPVEVARALLNKLTWWKVIASFLQASVLFTLFRMIGKKPI